MARPPLREVKALDGGDDAEARLARAMDELPPGCPFSPMGYEHTTNWLIDCKGQLIPLAPRELARSYISNLCDNTAWLIQHYPRPKRSEKGVVDSFRPEAVADSIIRACHLMGYWSPRDRQRGRGAWLGADDDLVLNLGDCLWIRSRLVPAGRRGDMVYEKADGTPRPSSIAQDGGAAAEILRRLQTWNWRRGTFDARLLLGWICAAMLGGALAFRPHMILTGEYGTGKSTLQTFLKALFGDGLISVSDATAAGLYQSLGHSSLPVAVDEFEGAADNAKQEAIIRLARQASSGGVVIRGSVGHHAVQFTARNTFLFSAVLMPPLKAQDRSRMAQLDLGPMQHTTPFELTRSGELGRALLRRVADEFPRLRGTVIPGIREQLLLAGWDSRGADLYSVLLACGDVALNESTPQAEMDGLLDKLEETRVAHVGEQSPEWRRCLDYLMATVVEPFARGALVQLGQLVLQAAGYTSPPDAFITDNPRMRSEADAERQAKDDHAQRADLALRRFGLRIVPASDDERAAGTVYRYLAVANSNPELARLFRDTHWRGAPGEPGAWKQALSRCPLASRPDHTVRFGGISGRCVAVPLMAALAGLVGPERPDYPDAERVMFRPDEPDVHVPLN